MQTLTRRQQKQVDYLANQTAEVAAGSSRYGHDDAGRAYSKDAGQQIGRNRGLTYVAPDIAPWWILSDDGDTLVVGTPGTEVWNVTDWRKARRLQDKAMDAQGAAA